MVFHLFGQRSQFVFVFAPTDYSSGVRAQDIPDMLSELAMALIVESDRFDALIVITSQTQSLLVQDMPSKRFHSRRLRPSKRHILLPVIPVVGVAAHPLWTQDSLLLGSV